MLYVFQMDTGQMLTFDMTLLMETVSRLQMEIAKTTGISVEKQILILSGGQSLKPDKKVITYGAGADTNPVFLFSKLAIESQEPPLIRSFGTQKDALIQLKDRISDAMKMRPSFETVTVRAKLAVQIRDSANKILTYCNNEFKEQHLQYQGWGAVVANLEEIAQALQRTESKFRKASQVFVPTRSKHFTMLESLGESLDLLNRIPLLDSLKVGESEQFESVTKSNLQDKSVIASFHLSPTTLLEWISSQAQGQSLESLQQKCFEDVTMFNEGMFETCDSQVQDLLDMVSSDKHQMKELVGIERRLSELEKRLNEAKKIARTQNDIAQGFLKHQSQLSTLEDAVAILPDLCKSHQHQLSQMMESQQRIFALQTNFRNSKQEMSTNIHQRLGWVMHIETQIAKLDSELIFHLKNLRILECNLDLLSQVQASPQVYAEMIVEATQRKHFALKFTQWAEVLVEDSSQLYKAESERRKCFSKRLGEHFLLHTLFKGFEDMPPNFASKVPRMFDASLPNITEEDISMLKSTVPELEESLSVGDSYTQFPLDQLSKQTRDSFEEKAPFAFRGSVSQTCQQSKPCVITATEAPPTLFTLPGIHESHVTEYHPALSSLTETIADALISEADHTLNVKEAVPKSDDQFREKICEKRYHRDNKETQTSPCVEQQCGKCLKVSPETSESHPSKQPAFGKGTSNTESSSPLSSNEFASADFYFEDSMPSPMVELPSEKKDKPSKEESTSKDNVEAIASLEDQLKEKEDALGELRNLLKEREMEVFKMQRQLNIGSNRSDESETVTLGPAHSEVEDSDKEISEGAVRAIETKMKGSESSSVLHGMSSLESSVLVQGRVKDLEQKLERLTEDLELSKISLIKAEQNLHDVQEQEQASIEEKNKLLRQLQEEITSKELTLEKVMANLQSKENKILDLEQDLGECYEKIGQLQEEATGADKTLNKVKDRLKEFALKTRGSMPVLKKDLEEMRLSVTENSSQLESIKMAALEILLKERENVALEKEEMEQNLSKIQQELSLEIKSLKSMNSDLSSELSRKEEYFAKKYAEQRYDYDAVLKDLETKHALELELELDKCKSETRESIEEWERNYDTLNNMKDKLIKEIDEAKGNYEKTVENLEMTNESNQMEIERINQLKTKELEMKFEQTLKELTNEKEKLKIDLAALEQNAKDHKIDWRKERESLIAQHQDAMNDLKESIESQRKGMDDILEKKQLGYNREITALKADFDVEKETLLAQLKKLTDHSLINSETQTGLGLLSEVISLTSSASDGSEEMNATRSVATSPEEKDADTGIIDLVAKQTQQKQEELATQLSTAQETITRLNEQLKALDLENKTRKDEMSEITQDTKGSEPTKADSDKLVMSHQEKQLQLSATAASFILMDKEQPTDQKLFDEMKMKDSKISQLEKSLMEMSSTEKVLPSDKVSIKGCDKGDLVLLCLDERHDQYVVFTVGTNLHFLHSESLECLGLKQDMEPSRRKSWILAEVVDKEYCLAKKPNNRFRVPQGTCFYRVKCQPWKCDFDAVKQDPGRKTAKKEQSETTSKGKK